MSPLLGAAVGAAAGVVSGALGDVGIDNQFLKDLAAGLRNNTSVLFVLVRKATVDKVLDEMKGTGGKILKTSLSHDDEAKLQAALSAATQYGRHRKDNDSAPDVMASRALPASNVKK